MKCLISLALAAVSSFAAAQIYTYDRLDHLADVVVTGGRFAAVSSMNDGETPGTFLHTIRADGSVAWTVPLDQILPNTGWRIEPGPKGGVTLFGVQQKTKKTLVSQLDAQGRSQWKREFPVLSARWAQDRFLVDDKGNALIYHGPKPTITRMDTKGKTAWTYELAEGDEFNGMVPLSDRSFVFIRKEEGTKIIQLNAKGEVVVERMPTAGHLLGTKGEKAYFQRALKKTSIFECLDMRSGKLLWATTGPKVPTDRVAIGTRGDLSISWSNNSQHSIAQFAPDGQLAWVKTLSPNLRLDAIRSTDSGRLQALTTPYSSSKVETTLHTYSKEGIELRHETAAVKSYGNANQLVQLNDSLYVFSLFGEFNPGETRATGLIAKIWRVTSRSK